MSPNENDLFTGGDSLFWSFEVLGDVSPDYLSVSLTNSENELCGSLYVVEPEQHKRKYQGYFYVDPYILCEGICFLHIAAEHEKVTANVYRQLSIQLAQQELKAIYSISGIDNFHHVHVLSPDLSSPPELFAEFPSDYAASLVHSHSARIYLCGSESVNLRAISLESPEIVWEKPALLHPPFHLDACLCSDESKVFVSFRKGYIKAYNKHGHQLYVTTADPLYEPGLISAGKDFIFAALKESSGHDIYIAAYYLASGDLKVKLRMEGDIIGLYSLNTNSCFILTTNDEASRLMEFDADNDKLMTKASFSQKMKGGCSRGDGFFLFDENMLFSYNESNGLVPWKTIHGGLGINFEPLNEILFIWTDKELMAYQYPDGTLINSFIFDYKLHNTEFYYDY